MSGRGMSGFGGKAGKGAVKRGPVKKRRTEEDAYDSDLDEDLPRAARSGPAMDSPVQRHCGGAAAAGPSAPAAATRKAERDANGNEALIRALRADKRKLTSTNEEHGQTITELREQLAAANAERDALQAENAELPAKNAELQAELDCYRGNRPLEEYTNLALVNFVEEGFDLLTSCITEQSNRIEVSVNAQYQDKKRLDSERPECPICQEAFKNAVMTPCGHTFCQQCLNTTLDTQNACPTCRGRVLKSEVKPNHALRDLMACLPETDHEADRVKQYKAEYAVEKEVMNKKMSQLSAKINKIADAALQRM